MVVVFRIFISNRTEEEILPSATTRLPSMSCSPVQQGRFTEALTNVKKVSHLFMTTLATTNPLPRNKTLLSAPPPVHWLWQRLCPRGPLFPPEACGLSVPDCVLAPPPGGSCHLEAPGQLCPAAAADPAVDWGKGERGKGRGGGGDTEGLEPWAS